MSDPGHDSQPGSKAAPAERAPAGVHGSGAAATGSTRSQTRTPAATSTADNDSAQPGPQPIGCPRISVIVPVYEQWELIPTLLSRLAAQTLPQADFEVLLIDNGSSAPVFPKNTPANVTICHCERPGSYSARNHGIDRARGEWLVFTDADCRPVPRWLETLMQHADAHTGQPALFAGAVETVTENGQQPNIWEIYDLVRGIPQPWYVSRGYATTANLAVPAHVARQLQQFDAERFSGGDADFCRRAGAIGVRLVYVPEAAVEHPARDSWPALARKIRRIKGGQLMCGTRRQRLKSWVRTLLPPVLALWRFARQNRMPIRYRATAMLVQFAIWAIEVREALWLLAKSDVERR